MQRLEVTILLTCKEDLVRQIGKQAIRAEIKEAVMNWGGQHYPGEYDKDLGEYLDPDPLFYPFERVAIGAIREKEARE